MPTTTIRLPEELEARIARAAERAGTTTHAFIVETIAEKADEVERVDEFCDAAEERSARIVSSGETIPWSEMRTWLEARAAGKVLPRPPHKKLTG